jgi:uncharacterized protein (DUF1697 family)
MLTHRVPTFIALLRGVNLGKFKRVPMAQFREMLAGLGYTDVVTLLNSGNAVFRATAGKPERIAQAIAKELLRRLKVEAPVIVKTARELAAIVEEVPITVDESQRSQFLVAFAQDRRMLTGLSAIEPLVASGETFLVGKHAAYLHCAAGILESRAGKALLGKAGKFVTTRNLATTLKLHALAGK